MPCNIFGRTSQKFFRELSTSATFWGPGILAGESTTRGRPDQNCVKISPTFFSPRQEWQSRNSSDNKPFKHVA